MACYSTIWEKLLLPSYSINKEPDNRFTDAHVITSDAPYRPDQEYVHNTYRGCSYLLFSMVYPFSSRDKQLVPGLKGQLNLYIKLVRMLVLLLGQLGKRIRKKDQRALDDQIQWRELLNMWLGLDKHPKLVYPAEYLMTIPYPLFYFP